MADNNSNDQGNNSSEGSSGSTSKKPPETPKPKTVGKICRDGQGYDD